MALLHSFNVVALVLCPIAPLLMSVAVLLIVEPLACVGCAVLMEIDSLPLCLVVHPFSFVYVSACLNETPHSVSHIIMPVSLIESALPPDLPTHPIALAIPPLATINHSVLELSRRLGFVGIGLCKGELSKFKVGISHCVRTYFSQLFEVEAVGLAGVRLGKQRDPSIGPNIFASLAISHFLNYAFPLKKQANYYNSCSLLINKDFINHPAISFSFSKTFMASLWVV